MFHTPVNSYPRHDVYEQLYARFFKHGPEELFTYVEPSILKGAEAADLCAGGGRLTRYLLDAGASHVTMVDESHSMLSFAPTYSDRVKHVPIPIEDAIGLLSYTPKFDVIACQQGVNYWATQEMFILLRKGMKAGGVFVFNTFNTRPSEDQKVLSYTYRGHEFVEISYLVGDIVHHVQTRKGLPPHVTSFKWIDSRTFSEWLKNAGFAAHETSRDRSSVWTCKAI